MSPITKLLDRNCVPGGSIVALLLAGAIAISSGAAQTSNPSGKSSGPAANDVPAGRLRSSYAPRHLSNKANDYYALVWGVDSLSVRAVESGSLIRFSYRVADPQKAALFNDKKVEAFLDAPVYRIRLVVPSLEKVGQLRQINPPEEGHSYWMAFSNPRRTVKAGDRVNVVVGRFHADGLIVE